MPARIGKHSSGFAWLPVVMMVALVGLMIPTVKYVSDPNVSFDIRKLAMIPAEESGSGSSFPIPDDDENTQQEVEDLKANQTETQVSTTTNCTSENHQPTTSKPCCEGLVPAAAGRYGYVCAPRCTPGQTKCDQYSGTDHVYTCQPNGQYTPTKRCDAGCSNGRCLQVCSPGSTRCEGDTLKTCSSDGSNWGARSCAYGCETAHYGAGCKSRPVASPSPSPSPPSCRALGQRCSNSLPCCSGYTCSAGECVLRSSITPSPSPSPLPSSCTSGETKCALYANQDHVYTCQSNGQYIPTKRCDGGCSNGVCQAVCSPNQTKCERDILRTCSSDGSSWGARSCAYGCETTASGSECGAMLMIPTDQVNCGGGDFQELCDDNITRGSEQVCAWSGSDYRVLILVKVDGAFSGVEQWTRSRCDPDSFNAVANAASENADVLLDSIDRNRRPPQNLWETIGVGVENYFEEDFVNDLMMFGPAAVVAYLTGNPAASDAITQFMINPPSWGNFAWGNLLLEGGKAFGELAAVGMPMATVGACEIYGHDSSQCLNMAGGLFAGYTVDPVGFQQAMQGGANRIRNAPMDISYNLLRGENWLFNQASNLGSRAWNAVGNYVDEAVTFLPETGLTGVNLDEIEDINYMLTEVDEFGAWRQGFDSPQSELVEHITGISTVEREVLAERVVNDHYILKKYYGLPPREMRWDNPTEYIRQLESIAEANDIAIRPAYEFESFFTENPQAGAVHMTENGSIIVLKSPFEINTRDVFQRWTGNIEHELVHGLQAIQRPGLPVEGMEYEAYIIANMTPGRILEDPSLTNVLFGDWAIGGSSNWWYRQQQRIPPWVGN